MGTCKDKQEPAGPQSKRPVQFNGDKGDSLGAAPLELSDRELKWVGRRRYGYIRPMFPPFPRIIQIHVLWISQQGRNTAVSPRLLNADPLAQIISTETVANVIIDDAEACALLDSRATTDLMTLAYAKARNFNIRPTMKLSDCFMNLRLVAGFKTTLSSYVEYNL